MSGTVRSWLKAPVFEDPEKNRIASVLYPIALVLAAIGVVMAPPALLPAVAPNPGPVLAIDVVLLALSGVCIWLVRSGRVSLAAAVFSGALWMVLTGVTYFFGGVSSPVVVTYLVVTPLAGFFWGVRAVVGFSVLSAAVALGMIVMEYQGTFPEPLSAMTPINSWLSLVVSLFVISLLLSLSIRSTDDALAEARANERAHRDAEERYRQLLEQSPDALFIHSNGILLFGNPAFASLVGAASADETLGQPVLDWVQHGSDAVSCERTREILRAEGAARLTPDRWRRRDGVRFPVEVSARALRFENRDAVQVIARDVSQREKLEEQLRQAQKMEAVGQFAGGIAHDFNNMLTAISGHNDFLLRSLPPGQQHDDAEEIQRAATRAAELVKQLLAFGRRQVLQPVVVDLNEEVLSMRSMLGRLLGGNIEIDLHLGDDLGTVKVDPVQVEQVLMNLAANARDSMPRGGRILIETRNTEITKAQRSEDADLEPGAYVTLVFTDTGVGMDEPIRARIFDPFFTTKDRFEGTGLGLSTVYGIVTQSGGAISVESDPGCGSTFTIHLPRCDEVREAARTESGDEVPGGRETLLVAEDDPAVRRLTVRFLTDAGYHVLEAANGSEALEVAEGWDAPIHLLLTDVVMPELGGGELTGRIKTSHPETRVLYVSGYPDDAIGNHGILAHETSFLPKPFTSEGLTAKVREVLDGD